MQLANARSDRRMAERRTRHADGHIARLIGSEMEVLVTQMLRIDGGSAAPSPAKVLREKLLDGMQLTQAQLARAIGISRPRLNMILKERLPVSAEIALRIERVFGITPQYWMRIRNEWELSQTRNRIAGELHLLRGATVEGGAEQSAWSTANLQVAA